MDNEIERVSSNRNTCAIIVRNKHVMRILSKCEASSNDHSHRVEQEPLDESKRELAARYMPLALSIARKFSYGWNWLQDELESAALVALVEAARNFDESRNVKFSTFLRKRVTGALKDARQRMCQNFEKVDYLRMGEDGNDCWGTTKSVSNLSPDELSDLEDKYADIVGSGEFGPLWEVREFLEDRFRRLPPRNRDLMQAIYIDHRSMDEIADGCGCTRSRLVVVHRESIDMLLGKRSAPVRTRKRPRRAARSEFSAKTEPDRSES